MPKAIITGDTKGVGLWMREELINCGYQVIGFSRTSNRDLTEKKNQKDLYKACTQADIFINNAHLGFLQTEFLTSVFELWKNESKLIICLGTDSFPPHTWKLVHDQYPVEKMALAATIHNLQSLTSPCKISLLSLGMLGTENCASFNQKKISKSNFLEVFRLLITSPKELYIKQITIGNEN